MTGRLSRAGLRSMLIVFGLVALPTVGVDQVTKALVVGTLTPAVRVPLLGNFLSLQLVRNPGAAFSFGAGATWVFIVIAVAVVAAVGYLAPAVANTYWRVSLGLLLGGAVGNLIDRLVQPPSFGHGHVVDFINYNGWFIGNVADIAIVVGVAAVVVLTLLGVPLGRPGATND